MPKRHVEFLSSVKDTIRRTRLKGAAEADGILAVKFIKLFSQVPPASEIAFFFPFFFFFCFQANSLFQDGFAEVERVERDMIWSQEF